MALTNTLAVHEGKQPSAPLITLDVDAALDASYPPGGYAFDPAALLQSLGNYDKAPTVTHVVVESKGGWFGEYDRANNKLKVLKGGGLAAATLAFAGLAIGSGSKAKVLIANTITYVIDGVLYQKTTAEIAFTATTHDIAADAGSVQEAVYLYSVDSAGTVTVTKSPTATGAGNAAIPATPAGDAPLGYLRLAVAAGATDFDASSDLLDAAHLTDTYVNLATNPTDGLAAKEAASGEDLSTVPGSLRVMIVAA